MAILIGKRPQKSYQKNVVSLSINGTSQCSFNAMLMQNELFSF